MTQTLTSKQHAAVNFPLDFALGIPSGRYAWAGEEGEELTFIWIKDYTYGKRNGQRRIRIQHGPWYTEAVTILPDTYEHRVVLDDYKISEVLMGVYCDIVGSARLYGTKLGRCARCAEELTVERSRHYGIGPSCEIAWPHFIEAVDNEVGATYEELKASGHSFPAAEIS